MTFHYTCPSCGATLGYEERLTHLDCTCPSCGRQVHAPIDDASASPRKKKLILNSKHSAESPASSASSSSASSAPAEITGFYIPADAVRLAREISANRDKYCCSAIAFIFSIMGYMLITAGIAALAFAFFSQKYDDTGSLMKMSIAISASCFVAGAPYIMLARSTVFSGRAAWLSAVIVNAMKDR